MRLILFLIFILVSITIGYLCGPVISKFISILIFFLLLLLVSHLYVKRVTASTNASLVYRLFYIRLGISFAFMIILNYYLFSTIGTIVHDGGDAYGYFTIGHQIADLIQKGNFSLEKLYSIAGSHFAYYLLNGLIYSIFGSNNVMLDNILMNMLNVFMGALIVIFVYQICREIFNRKIARIAGYLVCFNPEFMFHASFNLKDIFFTFSITAALLNLILFSHRLKLKYLILYSFFSLAAFTTRATHGMFWILISMGYLFISGKMSMKRTIAPVVYIIIFLFALSFYMPSVRYWGETAYRGRLLQAALDYNYALKTKHPNVDEQSVLHEMKATISSPLSIIKIFPLGIAKFVFTPLPWKVTGRDRFMIPGAMLRYFLYPLAVLGMYYELKRKMRVEAFFVAFFWLSSVFAIAILETGGLVRHNMSVLPLALIFAGLGIERFKYIHSVYLLIIILMILMVSGFYIYDNFIFD